MTSRTRADEYADGYADGDADDADESWGGPPAPDGAAAAWGELADADAGPAGDGAEPAVGSGLGAS